MFLTPAQIKPKSFESRRNSFFYTLWVDVPHVYLRALALGCFYSHINTRTFRRVLTASVDSCAEINLAEFGGRCRKAVLGVCVHPYLLGDSGGIVNSLDVCLASLKFFGCFCFRCVLSSQWKAVTVNLRILYCQR